LSENPAADGEQNKKRHWIMQQKTFIAPPVRCALFFLTTALLPVTGKTDETAVMPEKRAVSVVSEGRASYYADRFHRCRTASGERFSIESFTAAHRTLPFGTSVRVTNLDNGKEGCRAHQRPGTSPQEPDYRCLACCSP